MLKTIFVKSIKPLLIVLSLIVLSLVSLFIVAECTILRVHTFNHSDITTFENQGSQWISEDESISFTVFREIWYWSDYDEVESKRYIGFGEMAINDKSLDISCICSEQGIEILQFGHSANYSEIVPEIDVRLSVNAISKTEVIATVSRIYSGEHYFSVGQEIRFFQTNDTDSIDTSEYEFFVDGIQIVNAAANDTEVDIYETLDDLKRAK